MPCDGEVAATLDVPTPVDQQHPESIPRQPAQQRLALTKVEDVRRIDQRGDDDEIGSASAIVAKSGAKPLGDGRLLLRRGRPRRLLIGPKPGQRLFHPLRIGARLAAQKIEEKR